ncbi:PREDICTED: uncharacterized protein LOC105312259 [Amphimedon queenslandica]|uniref:Lysine-specific metallo-endopeptidase domain-containing protein n=2 Tax=Amphimedon queenslandica TaxID=400682 RepID=A0AAN0IKS0_AMPQE|nr:PREDICTED: uncharacterized protein LOC105312259 [Amphimedon queenslandica]|eukprot:XP_011403067.2 PREDICTED: uncharacterized protein LOC105312259 [Amphimedon queenslandica]
MKTVISIVFLTACIANAMGAWPISVDMDCHQSVSFLGCSFGFLNADDDEYYLLQRNTPLEGLNSPFVQVSLNEAPLQYEGRYVYRTPPSKDEYILLKPGQRVAASVRINDIFSLHSDGLYDIKYNKPLQVLSKDEMGLGMKGSEVEVSESVSIYLENVHLFSSPVREPVGQEEGNIVHIESCTLAVYIGGTKKERSDTTAAHKKLCAGFDKVKAKVRNDKNYTTWFGAHTASRANKVKGVYQKCRDGISQNTVTYNIKPSNCKSNWYAYTYHNSRTVFLCNIYFRDPVACRTSGTSKEGTLVHEWTHAFGLTEDYAYGKTNVKNLAKSHPDRAVDNAETYEFYYCRSK